MHQNSTRQCQIPKQFKQDCFWKLHLNTDNKTNSEYDILASFSKPFVLSKHTMQWKPKLKTVADKIANTKINNSGGTGLLELS